MHDFFIKKKLRKKKKTDERTNCSKQSVACVQCAHLCMGFASWVVNAFRERQQQQNNATLFALTSPAKCIHNRFGCVRVTLYYVYFCLSWIIIAGIPSSSMLLGPWIDTTMARALPELLHTYEFVARKIIASDSKPQISTMKNFECLVCNIIYFIKYTQHRCCSRRRRHHQHHSSASSAIIAGARLTAASTTGHTEWMKKQRRQQRRTKRTAFVFGPVPLVCALVRKFQTLGMECSQAIYLYCCAQSHTQTLDTFHAEWTVKWDSGRMWI